MAKKSEGFNLSAMIREFRGRNRAASAKDALEAIKKAHPTRRINENTFKSTFYKLAAGGKKRFVRRRKPGGRLGGKATSAEAIMRAGLIFIHLAGGVENARTGLAGLEELIATAKVLSDEKEGPIITGP
jgi:hypothetical protein